MAGIVTVLCLWMIRLVLTSDQDPEAVYAPHDHLLYTKEAFFLLTGGWLGPYDNCTLLKNPLLAYLLAFARWTGFTYRSAVEALVFITGLHLRRASNPFLGRVGSLVCVALFFFNPVMFDFYFWNVGRDGLLPLFTLNLALLWMGLLSQAWQNRVVEHWVAPSFCFLFALCLNLREEGILYLYFPATLVASAIWGSFRQLSPPNALRQTCRVALFAILAGLILQGLVALHIANRYGVFLYNDFRQGNFPKLIRALQSIDTGSKQTYVSISQKDLQAAARVVPDISKINRALPSPPVGGALYNDRCPVSEEWPDSHHFIWIKDAIHNAGLAPSAREFQDLCGRLAFEIRQCISEGTLPSSGESGGGIITFPRNRGEWVLVGKGFCHGLCQPFLLSFTSYGKPSNLIRGPSASRNFTQFGNMFSYVTYTPFDSLRNHQEGTGAAPAGLEQDTAQIIRIRRNLLYWIRYPDVAMSGIYGLDDPIREAAMTATQTGEGGRNAYYANTQTWEGVDPDLGSGLAFLVGNRPALLALTTKNLSLRAEKHFADSGKTEGRVWGDENGLGNPLIELPLYRSPLLWLRGWIRWLGIGIWVATFGPWILWLGWGWARKRLVDTSTDLTPLLGHLFFCGYAILFAIATGYISKNMGLVDGRLFYSVYLSLTLLGLIHLGWLIRLLAVGRQRLKVEHS